ncbi:MAG TPA: glycine oxidase ThiO [Pyrinomonadaceae bacterium]|nr:glycine oxidase ThiO [Pyrinomonadaceae bacterium]
MRNGNELPERAEVVVVGGGVVGLACVRELARRGAEAVLIERGAAGAESSWAAAGMLAPQVEADGADEFFALASASRDLYPDFARELEAESGVDIELDRTGTLYLAFTDKDEEECERRYDWQTRAGLRVERLTAREVLELEPQVSARVRSALRFPLDGQVENRRLVAALARSAEAHGARIVTHTEVTSINVEGERAAGVETERGATRAGVAVVVACGAWSSLVPRSEVSSTRDGSDTSCPRIEPVRGQILCYAPASPTLVRHVVYSPRGYILPRRDGRLLAGTTTEHTGFDKSVTDAGRRAITAQAEEIAPAVARLVLSDAWAGLRPHGADDRPVIGACEDVPNLFYATGHYRNGILLAPLTGALVAEMILRRGAVPDMLRAFTPARFRPASCGAV